MEEVALYNFHFEDVDQYLKATPNIGTLGANFALLIVITCTAD
jgi:hypothetical protein